MLLRTWLGRMYKLTMWEGDAAKDIGLPQLDLTARNIPGDLSYL
jgi:hypothetical protein